MKIKKPEGIQLRERRRLALYRAIVRRLRERPELWAIPLANLDKWDALNGPRPNSTFWRKILATKSMAEIEKMLLARSQRGDDWRKSSPFVGIISEAERNAIFERHRKDDAGKQIEISLRLTEIAMQHNLLDYQAEMSVEQLLDDLQRLGDLTAVEEVRVLMGRFKK